MKPKYIFIIGKVGSGKGTQAKLLAEKLGYTLFSTGDEFRRIIAEGGALGARVKRDYDVGLLMPDWFAQYLMTHALLTGMERGVVFESALRKLSEGKIVEEIVSWLEEKFIVFNLEISDETAITRVKGRARGDNLESEEKTRVRLAEYREHTVPSITSLRERGFVVDIDGERSIEEIQEEIARRVISD